MQHLRRVLLCRPAVSYRLRSAVPQIAAALDRQPSTVARELKRNAGSKVGYEPSYAQAQTAARRWTGSRLERDDGLRETILDRLADGWSPEQVCGRLARAAGHPVISHETVYRFVYAQLKRTNDRRWRYCLPRAEYRRGWRTRGGWPRQTDRSAIHDRPAVIATRRQAGHWEADAMLFSRAGQPVLVAPERHSRLTIAARQDSLEADPVARAPTRLLRPLPAPLRRPITFDDGTGFYRHQRIGRRPGADTSCDLHAPWQKGGIGTAIGRLRRDLPRKTDIAALPRNHLDTILAAHDNTPEEPRLQNTRQSLPTVALRMRTHTRIEPGVTAAFCRDPASARMTRIRDETFPRACVRDLPLAFQAPQPRRRPEIRHRPRRSRPPVPPSSRRPAHRSRCGSHAPAWRRVRDARAGTSSSSRGPGRCGSSRS